MPKLNFFQLPRTIKNGNRSLSMLLALVIILSDCYVEAFGNVSDNTTEASHQSQGLLQLSEYQLRCNHLLTLRMEHYHLLLASLHLAEAMEYSIHSDPASSLHLAEAMEDPVASQLTDELNEFQLARYSYRASWDQVQKDVEKVASANLSSEVLSGNQCQAENPCSPNVWVQGCYQCLPGKDGSFPSMCSHNTIAAGFLDVIGMNVRNFQEQTKERNCTDSHTVKQEVLDVERHLESMMMALNDVCSNGQGDDLSNLQNIYDQAQFLELKSKEMRMAIEKEYAGISVNCGVLNGELQVSKVEDVSQLPIGESGIRITVDGSNPCSKHVIVSVTPVSTPSGPCWYINETQKVSTLEEPTINPSFALTSSLIANNTEESTHVSSPLATQVSSSLSSEILTTEESQTTTSEKPTSILSNCSLTLKEMIEKLHHEIPQINEEFANVSLKAAECLKEASTFEEIGEVIYLLEIFVSKAKNMLHILTGNIDNGEFQSTPIKESSGDQDGFTKMSVSLRGSLDDLHGSIESLRNAFDRKDTKHRVITAARDIANIFTQGGDVGEYEF